MTPSDYFSSITAIMFGVLVIVFPLISLYFLLKRRRLLKKVRTKAKYGMLYEEMRYTDKWASVFHVIFCLRRLFMTLLIFFVDQYAFA